MIAVSLIEYGGQRAPLLVAAKRRCGRIGGHPGWIRVAARLEDRRRSSPLAPRPEWWASPSSVPGILDCLDPRGFGRSALLIAGCWLGGLGLSAAAVGGATWIVAYFLSMLGAWSETRQASGANASVIASVRNVGPLLRPTGLSPRHCHGGLAYCQRLTNRQRRNEPRPTGWPAGNRETAFGHIDGADRSGVRSRPIICQWPEVPSTLVSRAALLAAPAIFEPPHGSNSAGRCCVLGKESDQSRPNECDNDNFVLCWRPCNESTANGARYRLIVIRSTGRLSMPVSGNCHPTDMKS